MSRIVRTMGSTLVKSPVTSATAQGAQHTSDSNTAPHLLHIHQIAEAAHDIVLFPNGGPRNVRREHVEIRHISQTGPAHHLFAIPSSCDPPAQGICLARRFHRIQRVVGDAEEVAALLGPRILLEPAAVTV